MVHFCVLLGAFFAIIAIILSYIRLNFHLKIDNIRKNTVYKGFLKELFSFKNLGISSAFIVPWKLYYDNQENHNELKKTIITHNRIANVIIILLVLGLLLFLMAAILS